MRGIEAMRGAVMPIYSATLGHAQASEGNPPICRAKSTKIQCVISLVMVWVGHLLDWPLNVAAFTSQRHLWAPRALLLAYLCSR